MTITFPSEACAFTILHEKQNVIESHLPRQYSHFR